MSDTADKPASARIDKWLWAARFFKTRSLATAAVKGGKVHVNGDRVRPSRTVRAGDRLEIRRGPQTFVVVVCDVSEQRGPAVQAQALYEETEASREAREQRRAEARATAGPFGPRGRPDKRQRRQLLRFSGKGS